MMKWEENDVCDDDDDDREESTEYFSNLVSGPYMHIFLDNLRRDIQKSAKNKKTTGSSRRRWDDEEEVEPPKHEPPPKPLPAENLKSAIKTKVVNKGQRRKVTWAPDVYDPPPSSESHHPSEWPKDEKNSSRNEWPKEEEGDKGGAGEGGGIDQRHKYFNKKKGKKNGLKEEGDRHEKKKGAAVGAAVAGEGECKKKSQKNQHKGGGDAGRGGAGAKGCKDADKKQGVPCGDGKVVAKISGERTKKPRPNLI